MPKKNQSDTIFDPAIWRRLVGFWTPILYIIVIADFLTHNGLDVFLGPVCAIYIALLSVYTAQKEFERWHDYNIGRHPGEVYVIIWTMLIVILLGLEIFQVNGYHLPSEVFSAYIVVVGILAITRKSKSTYRQKKK